MTGFYAYKGCPSAGIAGGAYAKNMPPAYFLDAAALLEKAKDGIAGKTGTLISL